MFRILDGALMLDWLDQFYEDIKDRGLPCCLLGLDQHGSHQTRAFMKKLKDYGITPLFTPPGSTDVVAPGESISVQFNSLFFAC